MALKTFQFQFQYHQLSADELQPLDKKLVDMAVKALSGTHSRYSGFAVGAALMLQNGEFVTGANQENISYPCTTCAERTALNYAQTIWPDIPIVALAVVAKRHDSEEIEDSISPCGLCRQAIAEIERNQASPVRIILAGRHKVTILDSALQLLPFAF